MILDMNNNSNVDVEFFTSICDGTISKVIFNIKNEYFKLRVRFVISDKLDVILDSCIPTVLGQEIDFDVYAKTVESVFKNFSNRLQGDKNLVVFNYVTTYNKKLLFYNQYASERNDYSTKIKEFEEELKKSIIEYVND